MKKICWLIINSLLCFNIYALTYSEAIDKVTNYRNKFDEEYKPYIINNAPFKFDNYGISFDNTFTDGGMLNKKEFELSLKNNYSYLMTGDAYWTMTSNGSNEHFVIDITQKLVDNKLNYSLADSSTKTNKINAKATEYLKKETKVTGKGTYNNPWIIYLDKFIVTYSPNKGVLLAGSVTNKELTYGQPYGELPEAQRVGYTLKGWYTQIDGGGKINSNTICYKQENHSIYAQWTSIDYTITYNLDGGTLNTSNPTSYNVETNTITLNNPTKEGYIFKGWTGTGLSGKTELVQITKGSTGDREYRANWEADKAIVYGYYVNGIPYDCVTTGLDKCKYVESGKNWELAMYVTGELRVKSVETPIDLYMIGSGAKGGEGVNNNGGSWDAWHIITGGAGGNGGEIVTANNISLGSNTQVQVGLHIDSKFGTYTAKVGGGIKGGRGSNRAYYNQGGVICWDSYGGCVACGNGSTGSKIWNGTSLIFGNTIVGSSGGGGGNHYNDINGCSAGTNAGAGGKGMDSGSSCSNFATTSYGGNATSYGCGGGGGGVRNTEWNSNSGNYCYMGNGGNGSPGLVIIRNAR